MMRPVIVREGVPAHPLVAPAGRGPRRCSTWRTLLVPAVRSVLRRPTPRPR